MAVVFSKQRFDFACKTTIEQLKMFQKPKHSKKYVFLAECIENVLRAPNRQYTCHFSSLIFYSF